MAVRSSSVAARRFVSPTIRALMHRRSAELTGLALGLLGLALLVALASYDPRDPSLNTATSRHTGNLAGPVGAVLADLLLQGFGVAGGLPGLAMLTWAWRIASHRGLGSMAVRLAAMLAALPMLAAVLAAIPAPPTLAWPTVAGMGGAIGRLLATTGLAAGHEVMGTVGAVLVCVAGISLAVSLTLLTLGLSASEWRAAGRVAARTARFSVSGGRDAAGLTTRSVSAVASGVGRFARLLWLRRRNDGPAAGTFVRRELASGSRPVPPADHVPTVVAARTTRSAAPPRRPRQESLPLGEAGWFFPSLDLLKPAPARATTGPSTEALEANARLLETVLSDYGVQGSIVEIRPGPVVTLYELEPAPGIRSARVIGLADDIARSLSVTAVRIATVPGRNVIGIYVRYKGQN